jgi:hypothetical protein
MSRVLPRRIEVLVASFGGVGTTFLTDFIARWRTTNNRDDLDGFKHLAIPPVSFNPRVRFVYVFGDPVVATISLFRRGFQIEQSRKLLLAADRSHTPLTPQITLADYAAAGVDRLHFADHVRNWYDRYLLHPTLFLRYETLWEHRDHLVRFLGLPSAARDAFPPRSERQSHPDDPPAAVRANLERMYHGVADELARIGDCRLRGWPPDRAHLAAAPDFRVFLRQGWIEQTKFWSRRQLPGLHTFFRSMFGGLPLIGQRYRDGGSSG